MVVLDDQNEATGSESGDGTSLREERKRTGKYVAAGTAIFLSLLGLYEALARGTPEYAALFLPAVIMFVYLLWILHASKKSARKKVRTEIEQARRAALTEVKTAPQDNNPKPAISVPVPQEQHKFCRTYSIA